MTSKMSFTHPMQEAVRLKASAEEGVVVGRADHLDSSDHYLIRYKSNDGCLREQWWPESAIESIETEA